MTTETINEINEMSGMCLFERFVLEVNSRYQYNPTILEQNIMLLYSYVCHKMLSVESIREKDQREMFGRRYRSQLQQMRGR